MSGRWLLTIFLAVAAGPAAAAETYKWVDGNGVVNYSSTPPPGKFAGTKVVGERVSVVASDPSLGPAIAAMNARAAQRAQYEEADWQMRQRYLLAARASTPPSSSYGAGYDAYGSAYYPLLYTRSFVVGAVRRPFFSFRHR
jgi:hypothetical protein